MAKDRAGMDTAGTVKYFTMSVHMKNLQRQQRCQRMQRIIYPRFDTGLRLLGMCANPRINSCLRSFDIF